MLGATALCSFSSTDTQSIQSHPIIDIAKNFATQENSISQNKTYQLLEELALSGKVIRDGKDSDQRPIFVNAQADFEKAFVYGLQSKDIISITCIIHTPAPATPLCSNGEISKGLVDPSLLQDQERLLTVKKRPEIIRDLLKEGATCISVFPRGGRDARSAEQLKILDELLKCFPDRLKTFELDCTELPKDLIGASYIVTFADSQKYILSLRSYQANLPTDDQWGIWFGPIDHPIIKERWNAVLLFLEKHGFSL